MVIPTSFIHTKETELERIVQASVNTANGFYSFYRFVVLPRLIQGNASCVYLPQLEYKRIEYYWDRVQVMADELPVPWDNELRLEFTAAFEEEITLLDEKIADTARREWQNVEQEFWGRVADLFPSVFPSISEVEVRVTQFGTSTTFSVPLETKTKKQKLICYVRYDMPVTVIAEGIISALVRAIAPRLDLVWEGTEAVSDFLIDNLMLHKVLPQTATTLSALKSVNENLIEESREYLRALGVPKLAKLSQKEGHLFLDEVMIDAKIPQNQKLLLELLLRKGHEVVTFDEVAETLESKEFSLWAVHKHVQRLRDRLTELGFAGYRIQSVRGVGYSLVE